MALKTRLLGAIAVVLMAAPLLAGCSSTPGTIPNVVGKSVTKAEATLQAGNIPFKTTIGGDGTSGKRDTVLSQSPAAGKSNTGQIVILTVRY